VTAVDREVLAEVELGCRVFERGDGQTSPPGGVVVGIDPGGVTEHGEIRERRFVTLHDRGRRGVVPHVIPASRVDVDLIEPPAPNTTSRLIRALCARIAHGDWVPPKRTGTLRPDDTADIDLIWLLRGLL